MVDFSNSMIRTCMFEIHPCIFCDRISCTGASSKEAVHLGQVHIHFKYEINYFLFYSGFPLKSHTRLNVSVSLPRLA